MEATLGRAGIWAVVLLLAIAAIAGAQDAGFAIHMGIIAAVAAFLLLMTVGRYNPLSKAQSIFKLPPGDAVYDDDVVRWGVIATMFWGLAGLLAGLFIALQLAFPELNFEPYLNFGRVRPLHTSAVIFAFGGNAVICTSFYVVQRTCRARLALPGLGNVWQLTLKDTSLISIVGLVEIMRSASIASGSTQKPFVFYVSAACLYLLLTAGSNRAFGLAELWANRGARRA